MRRRLLAAAGTAGLSLALMAASAPQAGAECMPAGFCRAPHGFTCGCEASNIAIFTDMDNGRRIEATAGSVIYGLLTESPSTGYRWTYLLPVDRGAVVQEDYSHFTSGRTDIVGSPGVHLFAFHVPRPPRRGVADQQLVFTLSRPGETPVEFLRVDVHVRDVPLVRGR